MSVVKAMILRHGIAERFVELMAVDKKNVDGAIRVILLDSIGKATLPIDRKAHV